MPIEHKYLKFEVKCPPGDGPGGFEGLGAVHSNIDDGGDIIAPGAFKDAIASFLEAGVIGGLNHDWDNPIGHPIDVKETPEGLWVKAVFHATPEAQAVREMMRVHPESGRATIRKLSIGYGVPKGGAVQLKGADQVRAYWKSIGYTPSAEDEAMAEALPSVRLLKALRLFEISPVVVPANRRATILSAKALDGGYVEPPAAGATATADGPLGDTDDALAYAALGRLHDLLCLALNGIIRNEAVPLDVRLDRVGEACDQFRAALVEVLAYFLSAEAGEEDGDDAPDAPAVEAMAARMAARFKARFGLDHDHDAFSATLAAATAPSFAAQSRSVVSAVEGLIDSARVHREARLKDGRELSTSNRDALRVVRDGLRAHAATIDDMLARTAMPAKAIDAREAIPPPGADGAPAPQPAPSAPAARVDPAAVAADFALYQDFIRSAPWADLITG